MLPIPIMKYAAPQQHLGLKKVKRNSEENQIYLEIKNVK